MLAWLWKKLVGNFKICDHTFEVYKAYGTYRKRAWDYEEQQAGATFVNRCTKCGKMEIVKVEV